MYLPPHFTENRPKEIAAIVTQFPFATIVYQTAHGLDSVSVPVISEYNKDNRIWCLQGHIARNNDMPARVNANSKVLVIFRGEDAYVSPNWYPTKAAGQDHVPTWNYRIVQMHGRISFNTDPKFLRAVVGRLTKVHEKRVYTDKQLRWSMKDATAEFLQSSFDSIIGFTILTTKVEAKAKLGQNKDNIDRQGAAQALQQHGNITLADAISNAIKNSG